jgi:transposase InsO family protein
MAHNQGNDDNENHRLLDELQPSENKEIRSRYLNNQVKREVPSGWDYVCLYYINENNLETCPQIQIVLENKSCIALIDTGCQCSIISEEMYNQFKTMGANWLELPTQNVILKSAFTGKTQRVKRQVLVPLKVCQMSIDQILLISSHLVTPLILGMDFCIENQVVIDFPKKELTVNAQDKETAITIDLINAGPDKGDSRPRAEVSYLETADWPPLPRIDLLESVSVYDNPTLNCSEALYKKEPCPRKSYTAGTSLEYDKYGLVNRFVRDYKYSTDEGDAIETINTIVHRDMDGSIVPSKEEQTDVKRMRHMQVQRETLEEREGANREIANERKEGLRISATEHLNGEERAMLREVLKKYQEHFMKIPGKCNMFEYKFQMQGDLPKTNNARPIPFALRQEVRGQIQEMIKNGILEVSHSPYVNPLTVIQRANKPARICVDARRVNKQMIPDRTKTLPTHELLQRMHGAKYISSLDLISAFLQIPLEESSRKWTAFQFEGQTLQFTRTPFGFRNSLASFIRALTHVLGTDSTEYVLHYVDDILIYSKTYEDHLKHLDAVLGKLTNAGFTINLDKCVFGKQEVKFLGHVISDRQVKVDPDRVAAILKYPAPRNQKQLRQFLGTCNYHHRFIINYADYVAPLLGLLKKGTKWKWTPELQMAFETLREKFANTIHLIQPNETLPYIIHTDASSKAIGAVLKQTDEEGNINIVSTASRVMNSAEKRYTTCEQELLAVVYALEKFRIHVYGSKIIVNTDNRALIFLQKCAITSNRVARWLINIQEYDIEIQHIKGVNNHLADVLSRNPTGLGIEEINALSRPNTITVNKIDIGVDKGVLKDLKNLAEIQKADPKLNIVREGAVNNPEDKRYRIEEEILFRRDSREASWKAMLPDGLETSIIRYVHDSLGHAGADKSINEINQSFYIKNIGRKARRIIAACDICQRVKHPNRARDIVERSHLPMQPGELCAIDLYGPLPTGRGGVRYILVCLEVFSKHIKLYPLKTATTRACLNRLTNQYFVQVIKPKMILSDNGTQFQSPVWKRTMREQGVEIRYSAIRHPQSNPSERYMREIAKFCRIYCHLNHRKWAELIPHIERWINQTIASATNYTPVELLFEAERPNLFQQYLPKLPAEMTGEDEIQVKIEKAYQRMKQRIYNRRNQRRSRGMKWKPVVNEKVLIRSQPISDAIAGVTGKFIRPFEGPYTISKLIPPSTVELCDSKGKVRGTFNWKSIKRYQEATE